jgi:hypothetical protein
MRMRRIWNQPGMHFPIKKIPEPLEIQLR